MSQTAQKIGSDKQFLMLWLTDRLSSNLALLHCCLKGGGGGGWFVQNCASISLVKGITGSMPLLVEAQCSLVISKEKVDQYIDGSSFPVFKSHIF